MKKFPCDLVNKEHLYERIGFDSALYAEELSGFSFNKVTENTKWKEYKLVD